MLTVIALTLWALALGLHDQARGRLPNLWLALGAVLAIGWMLRYGQTPTGTATVEALLGAGLAFALLMPGYAAVQVGAGDVKYLAIIGLYLGPMGALVTAVLGYAVVLGVFWLLSSRALRAGAGAATKMIAAPQARPPLGLGLSLAFIVQIGMNAAGAVA